MHVHVSLRQIMLTAVLGMVLLVAVATAGAPLNLDIDMLTYLGGKFWVSSLPSFSPPHCLLQEDEGLNQEKSKSCIEDCQLIHSFIDSSIHSSCMLRYVAAEFTRCWRLNITLANYAVLKLLFRFTTEKEKSFYQTKRTKAAENTAYHNKNEGWDKMEIFSTGWGGEVQEKGIWKEVEREKYRKEIGMEMGGEEVKIQGGEGGGAIQVSN